MIFDLFLNLAERKSSGDISRKTPFFSIFQKPQRAIKVKPDDFSALYKILVSARRQGNSSLKPWEQAFEEELYAKLAKRLARKEECK